ncbi:predicted transcriptional regulator [Acetobacter aceti NRIC 0242]|nr:predicted transcriptional regulator [Acetobacter aceti NRIC 0242]
MPTLNPGDTILVDYTPEQIMESVYVVSVQGMLMVKRLSVKDPLTFSLVSDNERYKPFDIQMTRTSWANASTDADLRIIGRVVGRFHINV